MKTRFYYRNLKARYRDQREELKALTAVMAAGDTVFDVGANKGNYLWWMSRAVGPGRVIALEPQPDLANYLKAIIEKCRLDNVKLHAKAASDHEGTAVLHVPGDTVSPGASLEHAVTDTESCRSIEVPLVTLDGILPDDTRRVAALKIDVEGHEFAVFKGAQDILNEYSPLLVFECEERHMTSHTVVDVLQFLGQLGYEGSFINQNTLVPIDRFDPSRHQPQNGDRFWDLPGYCNNFILQKN